MVVGIAIGGVSGIVPIILRKSDLKKILVLRNCKYKEVKWARKVLPTIFEVNPSTVISKKESLEGQLASKGFTVYVQCMKSPWKLVLEDFERFLNGERIIVGDVSCIGSFFPSRCQPSALGLAVIDGREGELVTLRLGKPPSDIICVAQVLKKVSSCLREIMRTDTQSVENVRRIIDYLVAKNPNMMLLEFKRELSNNEKIYVFDLKCFYEKLTYLRDLRDHGPQYLRNLRCELSEGERDQLLEFFRKFVGD
ncbi:hypothetical protein EYM_07735 [Ignicoccus islandicus DSM 13165]|uniref:Uncharacterized protein n=1 Tax=Ignicoccus islandicus DSM 13165 TaxID=940295 RepID=A0A0U2MBU5_9CREN|nr:hypothetical protein [Ignicoccus islandicus]ALU12813.1 hypothetical protein EYM_07735 [Ignicoccus islandicus DSM 13165]